METTEGKVWRVECDRAVSSENVETAQENPDDDQHGAQEQTAAEDGQNSGTDHDDADYPQYWNGCSVDD
jgi:hypothetical protein